MTHWFVAFILIPIPAFIGYKLFKDFENSVNESPKFLENTFIRSSMAFEEAAG